MNLMTTHSMRNARAFPDTSSGGLGLILGRHRRMAALERVALRLAVTETRSDVAQIATLADPLAAKRTETLPQRHPAIDHDKSHVTPPSAKLWIVSDEIEEPDSGVHRMLNMPAPFEIPGHRKPRPGSLLALSSNSKSP